MSVSRQPRRHVLPHAAARRLVEPCPAAVTAEPIAFVPVPMKRRRAGGWTPDRQRDFIAALQRTGSVGLAAQSVGLSRQSALALRKHAGGAGFAEAWDVAIDMARGDAADILRDIAVHGHRVPLLYRGRQTGEMRRFDTRLLLRLLAASDRASDIAAGPALIGPNGRVSLSAGELDLLRTVLRKSRESRQV